MGIRNCNCTASAFRALLTFNQPITAFTPTPVRFSNEEFDLNNEYDLVAFVPAQDGVYSVEASVIFSRTNANLPAQASLNILVNNVIRASSLEVIPGVSGANSVKTSMIIELQAGDRVEVVFTSSQDGTIFQSSPFSSVGSVFEAARFSFSE